MTAQNQIGIGLYGANGHQIHALPLDHPLACVVAAAEVPGERLAGQPVRLHASLEELLADPRVQLVSLCSPRREEQAAHAILALNAGRHVYAEKPCALTEADIDAVLEAAQRSGCRFREMGGTVCDQPYITMREIVRSGQIGEVVEVIAEKSYPYHEGRPQDEGVDGGLIGQCALYGARWVEQVAGVPIASVQAVETTLGNPVPGGGLRMAAVIMARLQNGGVATLSGNYLNPKGTGIWGYETLRVHGTKGMIESAQGGRRTRLVIGGQDLGPFDTTQPRESHLELFLREIAGAAPVSGLLDPREEVRPTRWVLRARESL